MKPSEECYVATPSECGNPWNESGQRYDLWLSALLTPANVNRAFVQAGVLGVRAEWKGWALPRLMRRFRGKPDDPGFLARWSPWGVQFRVAVCFNHSMQAHDLCPVRDASGEWFFVAPSLRYGNGHHRAVGLIMAPESFAEEE